jgi:hypothetical protein
MEYRNVSFEVDVLGVDMWRWTLFAQNAVGPDPCWAGASDHEQAIAHCKAEIDAMLAREREGRLSSQLVCLTRP